MPKLYEHTDSLGQPIKQGQPVAFTSSYLSGVKVGTVVKLTRLRIKINYKYSFKSKDGQTQRGSWNTLIAPERTIQLGESLSPAITMFLLKNGN